MKRERRQLTRAEWERITSKRPVVRKISPTEVPRKPSQSPGPYEEGYPADRGKADQRKGAR